MQVELLEWNLYDINFIYYNLMLNLKNLTAKRQS